MTSLRFVSLVLCLVAALPGEAAAWSRTEHMVAAQLAYSQLSKDARTEVDRLIAVLADIEPRASHAVTASVWMDELRASGLRALDGWHYINLVYNPQRLPAIPEPDKENAVWAVRQAQRTLSDPRGSDFARAFMLRVLLHTVPDLHQPLHASHQINRQWPEGDRGGNRFLVLVQGEERNLHSVWDRAGNLWPRVGTEEWQRRIPPLAQELSRSVAISTLSERSNLDPRSWAQEGLKLAKEAVYADVRPGQELSAAYLQRVQQLSRQRLVLAGHRLAQLLEKLLGEQDTASGEGLPQP